MECRFYNNIISYHKDKTFFHLGYRHNGSGRVNVAMCSMAWAQVKALFATCGGIIHWPLDDVVVLHLNGSPENVAIKMPNPSMEGKLASTFQMEGVWIYTPPTNSTKGFNRSTNYGAHPF